MEDGGEEQEERLPTPTFFLHGGVVDGRGLSRFDIASLGRVECDCFVLRG